MTPELSNLFFTMAILGLVTGIFGFLSERYENTKYGRVLMSLTIMFGLIMLYKIYQTFKVWSLM
tara:strand:- start:37136 stop:37327 length:192 start_codon:yes stop_codon:yes gene_type:complete